MQHHFSVEVAVEYGINSAIMLEHFYYWQKQNEVNEQNYINGRYWTYNSVKAFQKWYPYLTLKQIRTAIQKLLDCGLLEGAELSTSPYDHTKWYSLTEEGLRLCQVDLPWRANVDLPSEENRFALEGKSTIIQLKNNTVNKPIKYTHGEFQNVLLTEDELAKLKEKFPSTWEQKIENLSQYIASKGKNYKNHYATILNWARRDDGKDNKEHTVLGVIHY